MGARGPSPKPLAIQELDGNRSRKAKRDPETLVKPEIIAVDPPKDLPPDALKAWEYLSRELLGLRVLTGLDAIGLEMLCRAYSSWRDLQRASEKDTADLGLQRAATAKMTAVRALLREYGLTPSSRAGLEVATAVVDPIEDELAALLD